MLKEFREFVARGHVMDLAVGIIIGAAVTAVVNAMVADLINPLIGLVTGGVDFSKLFVALSTEDFPSAAAAEAAGVAVFKYGSFLSAVISFLIIAWVVFLLVKANSRLRSAVGIVSGPTQQDILIEIRDLLKQRPAAPFA